MAPDPVPRDRRAGGPLDALVLEPLLPFPGWSSPEVPPRVGQGSDLVLPLRRMDPVSLPGAGSLPGLSGALVGP
jgi:hypothetical protein